MRKGKLLVLGLITLMLVGGLVLASCKSETVCNVCNRNESDCKSICGHSNKTCNCNL